MLFLMFTVTLQSFSCPHFPLSEVRKENYQVSPKSRSTRSQSPYQALYLPLQSPLSLLPQGQRNLRPCGCQPSHHAQAIPYNWPVLLNQLRIIVLEDPVFFSITASNDFIPLQALPTAHQKDSCSPRKVLGMVGLGLGFWKFWLKFREVRKAWAQ